MGISFALSFALCTQPGSVIESLIQVQKQLYAMYQAVVLLTARSLGLPRYMGSNAAVSLCAAP